MLENIMFWISLIITYFVWKIITTTRNLPPGPWGFPLFGILPLIYKNVNLQFQDYCRKYGKISSFYMGQKLVILLSDFDLIKEAFIKQGDNFSGRPDSVPFKVFPTDIGIVTADGYNHKQIRSYLLTAMKDHGAIRAHFESTVKENAETFVKYLDKLAGQKIEITDYLGASVALSYCKILLGVELEHGDPLIHQLALYFFREQRHFGHGARVYLPWMKKIPILSRVIGENEIREIKNGIYSVVEEFVQKSKQTYTEGSRDTFIHSWFTEEHERKKKNASDNLFNRKTLVHNINALFSAGYDTTTTTLRWSFIYLVEKPEIQEKLFQELYEVIGLDGEPSLADCARLPYMMATMQEIYRFSSIVPLAVVHRNKTATTLDGFNIPESCFVYPNIYSVHFNPDFFPEPYVFKPERFIDEYGKYRKDEHVMPFSLGKRQCPGESLAQIEIFLYLTNILLRFRLEPASKKDKFSFENRSNSVSSAPKQFFLRFVKRNN